MSNTLIDNSDQLKMVDTLQKLISNPDCKIIKIATGFWDIPGLALVYPQLKEFLERGDTELQLLIGTDPIVRAYQLQNPIVASGSRFPEDYIKREISDLQVTDAYVDSVRLLMDFCKEEEAESKFKVRIYRKDDEGDAQFLHAKCYIFLGENDSTCGIIGSSNFTQKGLEDNAELNHLETSAQIVTSTPGPYNPNKGHQYWFDEKWKISKPWNKIFLEEVLRPSKIGVAAQQTQQQEADDKFAPLTPYEVYIKYLQNQLGDIANPESKEILKSYLPMTYNPLGYQLDAVLQCFYIMRQHGGFILADVVGLGKTVVGIMLIKKFINEAHALGRSSKVLIVTPPAIKSAWQKTIDEFDEERTDKIAPFITFITTGSIAKINGEDIENDDGDDFDEELKYDNYGLIIVDESHNFRNREAQKYKDLDSLINNIELRTGSAPFIGLLSATPQNNAPIDIYNQILLFQREPGNSTLPNIPGGKLNTFMTEKNKEFRLLRKDSSPEAKVKLQALSTEIREKVLNELVVRRTRRDIKEHYSEDSVTLHFPDVKGPHKLEYKLDKQLCSLFADTIDYIVGDPENDIPSKISYFRYAAINYFTDPENTKLYEKRNLTVESITQRLANIMRILLVKRLESSFTAFKKSLHNLQQYTQNMIEMVETDTVFVCPDIDVNALIAKYGSLHEAIPIIKDKIDKKGGNNRQFRAEDFKEEYLEDLKSDKKLIDELCRRWDANDYDPKLDAFKTSIDTRLFDAEINNPSGFDKPRLVIFSEAIDTVDSISRVLENKGYSVLKITAANREAMESVIKENFDANSEAKKDDYNVIVTTEVLAEGVNLHRANVILNYDAPWNATRLMQRIGRVNRIGSKEEFVHVFNFFPSTEGNEQIHLEQIAYAKLQAFHTMFGEDNKVFTDYEELSEAEFKHIIDDELSPLSEYIKDLKDFRDNNPERYDYILKLDFDNLGGVISSDKPDCSLAVINSDRRGFTNILIDEDNKATVVAPIVAMKFLKCEQNAKFIETEASERESISELALSLYNTHVNQMRTARDTKGAIKKAMKFLNDEIKPKISREVMAEYNRAFSALRNGSYAIAEFILKFEKEYHSQGATLFGADYDLSSWVTTAFSHIADRTQQQFGEPHIALIETNKSIAENA